MDSTERLTKAIRGLTVAVWAVGLVAAIQLVWGLWAWFRPQEALASAQTDAGFLSASNTPPEMELHNDFSAYPPEEKIRQASVILITQSRVEGGRSKAMITEIVKRAPEIRFYYSVGQEFPDVSHGDDSSAPGTGQVVFMTGNPARMNVAYSYENDRIGSLGGMTLDSLRQLAAK